jgi:nitrous oxidase accessory protein
MKRYLLVAAAALAALTTAHAAGAATLCVGPHGGCFAQIQPAVTAAHDGDTITVAPGTYVGGITIDKSIKLQGTSAEPTISGGGPV